MAASTPIFASKFSFCSIFRDLQFDMLLLRSRIDTSQQISHHYFWKFLKLTFATMWQNFAAVCLIQIFKTDVDETISGSRETPAQNANIFLGWQTSMHIFTGGYVCMVRIYLAHSPEARSFFHCPTASPTRKDSATGGTNGSRYLRLQVGRARPGRRDRGHGGSILFSQFVF